MMLPRRPFSDSKKALNLIIQIHLTKIHPGKPTGITLQYIQFISIFSLNFWCTQNLQRLYTI